MRPARILSALASAVLTTSQLVAPPAAAAQQGWDAAPAQLSAVPVAIIIGGQEPRVAMSSAGDAVAVWTEVPALASYRVVRAASYEKAAGGWTPATTLYSSATQASQDVNLAADAAGNAIAVWTAVSPGNPTEFALASRYSAATHTWTDLPLPATNRSAVPIVAMNAAGDAVIAWRELTGANAGLHAVRYSRVSATWSSDERPAGPGVAGDLANAAIDDAGNIHVVWRGNTTIQASRFSAAGAAWSPVVGLGPYTDINVVAPHVAMNGAGDAVTTWESGGGIQAVLRSRTDSAWSAPSPISSGSGLDEMARPAIDPAGAVVVAWRRTGTSGAFGVQARRYVAGSGWSPITDLVGDAGQPTPSVAVAVDAVGNAFVLVNRFVASFGDARLLAARFAVSTGSWTVTSGLSAQGQFAVLSDVAVDPAGNAVAVWFQSVGAQITQALRWDATASAPSILAITPSPLALSIDLGPQAPMQDPALTPTNLEYSLDGGATWTARTPASLASPLVVPTTDDVPTYSLSLRALNSAGAGRQTSSLAVRTGTGGTPAPLRVVSVVGTAVTLAWSTPAAGIVATDYALEGGVAPGQTLASLRLGSAMTMTTLTGAPAGIFYLRLTALSGAVRGGTSNEVRVVVGVADPPAGPTGLLGLVNGSTLTLSWTTVAGGGAPSNVVVNVTGAASSSAPLPVSESFSFPNVPPGSYTFTVAAMNAAGSSAPSNPITLSFPGPCSGVPSPPSAVSAGVVGNVVSLAWEPPQSGPAVSGYELVVTGAFAGRVPVPVRSVSGAVGAGLYRIGVAAVNACGTGLASAALTIVVP